MHVAKALKKSSIIGIREYKRYSDAEVQFIIPSTNGIKNCSTDIDQRKSIFNLNKSWKENLSQITSSLGDNTIILVNGVVNSGKSTFASCLIN